MQTAAGPRREGGGGAAATGGTGGTAVAPSRTNSGNSISARQRTTRIGSRSGSTGSGGLQPLQQKLQQHIDREDRRIKELTEGILYDFFPAALRAVLPPGADPAGGLTQETAAAVASAALAVATLMNAPPGFLEFLLCVPWADLGPLYLRPQQEEGGGELAMPQLQTSQEERAALVNSRLNPALMDCVLAFLYREQHQESLPPMIRLSPGGGSTHHEGLPAERGAVTRDTVAALLDGATPLHCAAIRGNPAQVDHLLLCGADPLLTNAAGELPLEVVPVCGDRCLGNGKLSCRCMGARDQEAWECRSRLARTLILRRCIVQFGSGLSAWLRMAMLCLLCLLGFWGNHTTLHRPAIAQHASRRAQARRKRLLQQTQATLLKMRTNAASGLQALNARGDPQGQGAGAAAGARAAGEAPQPHESSGGLADRIEQQELSSSGSSGGVQSPPQPGAAGTMYACTAAQPAGGEERPQDYAYACFTRAVHLLKELDLRPGSIPAGFLEAAAPGERHAGGSAARVPPDEQAAIYCGCAEAALQRARSCQCSGCAALAMHAVASGQKQVAALLASPDLSHGEGERVARVGAAMARLVHCKSVLLLQTDVRHSATRAGIWRAQQCLQEWERLHQLGMTAGLGEDDCLDLHCLEGWCRASSADLLLLETLQGGPLLPLQPLAAALPQAVNVDPTTGVPTLQRPVGRDVVRQLMAALAAARPHASEHIVRVAEAVARNLQSEISAGDRLRELLQPRSGGMNLDDLLEAVRAAERYPSLHTEVEQARALRERWTKRAEAQAQFDTAVESMSGPASSALLSHKPGAPPNINAAAFWEELASRVQRLEEATEEARQANIGVAKAKRVLKELQAQGAAVEAAARLDEALAQPRCFSAALKSALSKAEAAATAAAPGSCQFAVGLELLHPRIQAVKQKLEVERAAEGLARAASTCKAVADLPRLEAAILAARKVGAQELDQDSYKAASELRLRLDGACRARGALEASLRTLQKMGRQEDADAVERCIEESEQCGELLLPEAARAREAVQRWRTAAASEARLTRALRDGVGTAPLSRAIKDAAAAGVKVGEARRLLKLMQGLEAAMQQATEGPFQYQALKSRIEQSEVGGCPEALVSEAKRQLHRLLLAEVRSELDAALKLSRAAEKSVAQRLSSLKAVLDKADVVLLMDEELQQQQQQAAAAATAYGSGGGDDASECSTFEGTAGSDQPQQQRGPRALNRSDTGLSAASSSGAAGPGSGGSLPPGLSAGTARLDSGYSDQGSPTSAAAVAAAAAAAAVAAVPPSVYVSAAPSVQLERAGSSDADVAVLLEVTSEGIVQLSILLPAGGEGEEEAGVEEEEDEELGELPAELAGDELAVVKHMVRQARRLLAREEEEQARIERERQEEARARREQQLREKAERERADRERAEKARAERAERKAALEQQKAERRERERQQRLDKERQRQEREKLAKEHFALLQKQRRLMAQPPPPAAPPVPPPAAPALPLAPVAPSMALPQAPVGGSLFATLPAGGAGAGLAQRLPGAAALELWAASNPAAAASVAGAAGFSGLSGLLQHVQHDRSDSLERLSEQQGLLELLEDRTPTASSAAAGGPNAFARLMQDAPEARAEGGAAGDAMRSPDGTATSDGWESATAAAGMGGDGSGGLPLGGGRWSSMEGSMEGLSAPESTLSPEPSPLKQRSLSGGAPTGPATFLDFPSSLWLAGSSAGAAAAAAANASAGMHSGWSSLDAPALAATHQQQLPLGSSGSGGAGGGGSGGGLLWGSGGSLSSAAAAAAASPSRLSVQDDLALTGLGSSRLWQSGAAGAASSSGGDGWAEVLGGSGGGGVASQQGGSSSLLSSPQRPGPASATGGGGLPGMGGLGGSAALALLQQRRQHQLMAALDAAKAHLLLKQQQQQHGMAQHAQHAQQHAQLGMAQQPRQVCKYFLHGYCREGDACRFAHVVPTSAADTQHQQQRFLGLQRLSGGSQQQAQQLAQQQVQQQVQQIVQQQAQQQQAQQAQQQQPQQAQQQPGGGGLLSFGAPGAAAFAGTGAPGSAAASRAATPDVRLGLGSAAPGSAPAGGAGGAGVSGFSVTAPAFSPRDPLGGSGGGSAVGGFPPSTASLPAFAARAGALALEGGYGAGRGHFGGSRPGSAANSTFATPRDALRLSVEKETFEDARDAQPGVGDSSAHYRLQGGQAEAVYGEGEGAETYVDAYTEGEERQEESNGGGGYRARHSQSSPFRRQQQQQQQQPSQYPAFHSYQGYGGGAATGAGRAAEAQAPPAGDRELDGYEPVGSAGQQDSYGLPSEASLFQDLPDFLKDTTDE